MSEVSQNLSNTDKIKVYILYFKKIVLTLQQIRAGCSSARLEYTSGGRVVGRSNRLTPTKKSPENQLTKDFKGFFI